MSVFPALFGQDLTIAGGGDSVVYCDAIATHSSAHELVNYSRYSATPTKAQIHEYTKTISNVLTNARSLKEFKNQLIAHQLKIFIRCRGPNYQESLEAMCPLGESLAVPIRFFGPNTRSFVLPSALTSPRPDLTALPIIQPDSPPF
ncbi:hypothetical protein CVT26_001025 [Gymnopilus dilepis]|uniref:ATP-citrate synthase citrate-binding domain-containing protein n=1 Tax=Gymnopilus dilepis TaxID=231916 RepID=A0A409Y256_9AGAR|nr:hypothetical protein CVT26_001025 [Gymnopilus dilepis]